MSFDTLQLVRSYGRLYRFDIKTFSNSTYNHPYFRVPQDKEISLNLFPFFLLLLSEYYGNNDSLSKGHIVKDGVIFCKLPRGMALKTFSVPEKVKKLKLCFIIYFHFLTVLENTIKHKNI